MPRGRNTTGKARKRKSLLNLATVAAPPFITIDGVDYDIVTRETASILMQHRAAAASEELGDADIKAAVDAKDWGKAEAMMARIDAAQSEIVAMVVPALPADVLARLSMTAKSAIISAFTGTASRKTPTETPSPESPQTGESGFPDSTDSTEPATPGSG